MKTRLQPPPLDAGEPSGRRRRVSRFISFILLVSVSFQPFTLALRPGSPSLSTSLLTPRFLSVESLALWVADLGCLITDLVPPDLTFYGGFPNPSRFSPVSVPVSHHRHRAAMLTSPSTNTHPLLGLKPFILSKLSLTSQIRRRLRTEIGIYPVQLPVTALYCHLSKEVRFLISLGSLPKQMCRYRLISLVLISLVRRAYYSLMCRWIHRVRLHHH